MKSIFIFLSLFLLHTFPSYSQDLGTMTIEEVRQKQLTNINNPSLWDMERLKEDIEPEEDLLPIRKGAFPVAHYDSISHISNSYARNALIGNNSFLNIPEARLKVADKEVVFASYHLGNSLFYKPEDRHKAYFIIVTVTDSLNNENNAVGKHNLLSRNHPDYMGQGSFVTKNHKIEYVSFTTPDRGSFAVVNMRLFHLEHGNLIIVTPQKDGSFRSLQLHCKDAYLEKIWRALKSNVLQRKEVIQFITDEGVI